MSDKKTTELTPVNIGEGLKVQAKLDTYEEALDKNEKALEKEDELIGKINDLLESAGYSSYSEGFKESQLKVYVKDENDEDVRQIANVVGSYANYLISSSQSQKLERLIGADAFKKLRLVSDCYTGINNREVDTKATKKLWEEYSRLVGEKKQATRDRMTASRKLDKANKFVNYANSVADIARKTS